MIQQHKQKHSLYANTPLGHPVFRNGGTSISPDGHGPYQKHSEENTRNNRNTPTCPHRDESCVLLILCASLLQSRMRGYLPLFMGTSLDSLSEFGSTHADQNSSHAVLP